MHLLFHLAFELTHIVFIFSVKYVSLVKSEGDFEKSMRMMRIEGKDFW